jgi:hypothetical protein
MMMVMMIRIMMRIIIMMRGMMITDDMVETDLSCLLAEQESRRVEEVKIQKLLTDFLKNINALCFLCGTDWLQ